MATIMRKKPHAHRKANAGIELNATTLLLLAGAGVAAYFLFIKKSDATETPDAPVTGDPGTGTGDPGTGTGDPGTGTGDPGTGTGTGTGTDPAAVAAANLTAYSGSSTYGRAQHAYSAAELQARANLQANARLGIIGNANYTGQTEEQKAAALAASQRHAAAIAAQNAARLAAGPTALGSIDFISDVPGGILQVNGASIDISVPTSGAGYRHRLPAPATYKFGVKWPDGKITEFSTLLQIGSNGLRKMNPPGYVAQNAAQRTIATSTDTVAIAKATLLQEAVTAFAAKQYGLAIQKYAAIINTYPGSKEAGAAQVTKSILELRLRTGSIIEGVK